MLSIGSNPVRSVPVLQWSPDGWRLTSPAARSVTAYIPTPNPLSSSILDASMRAAVARSITVSGVPQVVADSTDLALVTVPGVATMSARTGVQELSERSLRPHPSVHTLPMALDSGALAVEPSIPSTGTGVTHAQEPAPNIQRAILGYTAGLVDRVTSPAPGARRVGSEAWAGVRDPRSVHVSQVPSRFNPSPAPGNRDCGPASVVMALRLVGSPIPGATAADAPQKLINRARRLTGNLSASASTTNHELARALRAAGASTREIMDAGSIKAAVLAGKPVILNGNPRHAGAYGWRFTDSQMQPYNGAHWIVVSGWDSAARKYIINDPLSKVGAVKVSPAQLEAYRGGSLGIEVSRT